MDFAAFADRIRSRLNLLTQNNEVYHVSVSRDVIWETYLASFPAGTNPIFRERTEHDCACCRQFVKGVGGLVALDSDGKLLTIWDIEGEGTYGIVSQRMNEFLSAQTIDRVYRSSEPGYGKASTIEKVEGAPDISWDHFSGNLPKRLVTSTVGEVQGGFAATKQVLGRGLAELSTAALEVVIELVENSSIYRGEEHLPAIRGFAKLKEAYDALPEDRRENFVWANLGSKYARFRNTAIGTLIQDLSEGMDLAKAVGRFESKVAPANYKRSSAPITAGMIKRALAKLRELGLEDAVQRRYATISDVSINDVLFVDRGVQPLMRDALSDLLMGEVKPAKTRSTEHALDISSDEFFATVLPFATSVSIQLDPAHLSNFVSLTAPVMESSGRLFKWANDFAWCYDGGLADSEMRQRVQQAGGRVDGVFRYTHSWNHEGRRNASLMDLHVFLPGSHVTPSNGVHNTYGNSERVGWNHLKHYRTGGTQDVDYRPAAPVGYVPVENITFPDLDKMPDGRYICKIHNWRARNPNQGGFKAEIEFGGQLFEYDYPAPLANQEWVTVAEVTLRNGAFDIKHHLDPAPSTTEKWGIRTGQMVPVDSIMLSPNHWGPEESRTGNRHHIFVLRGCTNPEGSRGFLNEYLRSDLTEHRKVFEVLGSKLRCGPSDDQLSGVGFSSTKRASAIFSVQKDGTTRMYNVKF